MRFRPMPILTLLTIALLFVLFNLGNWQWRRYEFKSALEAAPPAPFEEMKLASIAARDFQRYRLIGTPSKKFITIETSQNGKYGKRVFTIVNSEIGKVFYELGFVAEMNQSHNALIQNQLASPLNAEVVLRQSHNSNPYMPKNNAVQKRLFWPEGAAMEQVFDEKVSHNDFYFTPILQDPLGTGIKSANPYADPKGVSYVEPARHLGYALTWWGLALGLIGVYIAMHIKAARLTFKPK